jgi:hypothetical protein
MIKICLISYQVASAMRTRDYEEAWAYEGVSKSFWTGHLEWELQMVQLSATGCSFIAILWVSLVSFATITLCVASQWVILKVSIYFVIDSVQGLLDTLLYLSLKKSCHIFPMSDKHPSR